MSTTSRMKYSLGQIESGILRLKWLAAATRFEIAMRNHDRALKAGYRADQPRVLAGNSSGGQWTHEGGTGRADPRVLSDATSDNNWKPGARYAQNVATGSGSRSAAKATDVLLPDGSRIPDNGSPTGYLQSPVADLSAVAQAGQRTGSIYRALLENPQTAPSAVGFLGASLYRDVSIGGTFDYQREGGYLTGFVQLRQYRNVSNFNVGLYSQQAGLSLDETLSIAGIYARFFSSNADPSAPYGLNRQNIEFTELGFHAGQGGVFGPSR